MKIVIWYTKKFAVGNRQLAKFANCNLQTANLINYSLKNISNFYNCP